MPKTYKLEAESLEAITTNGDVYATLPETATITVNSDGTVTLHVDSQPKGEGNMTHASLEAFRKLAGLTDVPDGTFGPDVNGVRYRLTPQAAA